VAFIVSLLPTLNRLRRLIRRERIQAVNVHYPIEAFCVFGMLRWLLPIKLGYKVTTHFIAYHDRLGVSTMNPFDTCKWTAWRIWRVWTGKHTRKTA